MFYSPTAAFVTYPYTINPQENISCSGCLLFHPYKQFSTPHKATLTLHTNQGDFLILMEAIILQSQTITFNPLPEVPVNITPNTIDLNQYVSIDSSLPLTCFSSNDAVATVSGSTLIIKGRGTADIYARQDNGNDVYGPTFSVFQTLIVDGLSQSITFNPLSSVSFGAGPITLGATASSGLAVTYQSSNTSVATISGNTVTIVGGGSTTITAKQAGNSTYNAAANVPQTLVVNPISQSITFNSL